MFKKKFYLVSLILAQGTWPIEIYIQSVITHCIQ